MILSSHQPNFLPYMGFFYKLFIADVFVLSDDHQYSRNGLHNSNFVKIGNNKHRISVPVSYSFGDKIKDVAISYTRDWVSETLKMCEMNYKKSPFYNEVFEWFKHIIQERPVLLSELNARLIIEVAQRMNIKTEIKYGHSLEITKKREARIIELCKILGADTYYSGIGGKAYNVPEHYEEAGIKLVYTDYQPIRYYQPKGDFVENLSVLDYVFNMGFNLPKEWTKRGLDV